MSKKKQAWLKAHLPKIEAFLVHGELTRSFHLSKAYHYAAIEDYFSDYLSVYKIDPEDNILKEFVKVVLTKRYIDSLSHRKWSIRMNTLYFIQLFKMTHMQDNLLKLLHAKYCSAEEEYLIFIILADQQYNQLLKLFSSSSRNIPPFLLGQTLSQLIHQDNFEEYVNHFDQLPYKWKLSVLDVFRDKHLRSKQLHTLLEHLILSEDNEMRLRAIKTVGILCYITSPNVVVNLWTERVGKKEWDTNQSIAEKVMLARLMGNIKHESFFPFLEQLITDKGYAVRNEAAKAIRKYREGSNRLLHITEHHADSYARNIAKEWLERSITYE